MQRRRSPAAEAAARSPSLRLKLICAAASCYYPFSACPNSRGAVPLEVYHIRSIVRSIVRLVPLPCRPRISITILQLALRQTAARRLLWPSASIYIVARIVGTVSSRCAQRNSPPGIRILRKRYMNLLAGVHRLAGGINIASRNILEPIHSSFGRFTLPIHAISFKMRRLRWSLRVAYAHAVGAPALVDALLAPPTASANRRFRRGKVLAIVSDCGAIGSVRRWRGMAFARLRSDSRHRYRTVFFEFPYHRPTSPLSPGLPCCHSDPRSPRAGLTN